MKKLLIILPILALVAAGCNKADDSNTTPTPPDTTYQTPPAPTTATYSNATYNFQFDYPILAKFVSPTYTELSDKIVQVQIGADQYPKTNLADAAFAVSAQSAKTLDACLKLSAPENSDGFKTKTTVAGIDFYMTTTRGAAAGNLYEGKSYRAFINNGTCLELNETIHTGNIGNYPAGTVTEVDKTPVQAKLDIMLNSFEFTH